jgi:hypothetical protein
VDPKLLEVEREKTFEIFEGPDGAKLPSSPCANGSARRKNVAADAVSRELTTKVLEFELRILSRQLLESEANAGLKLGDRQH